MRRGRKERLKRESACSCLGKVCKCGVEVGGRLEERMRERHQNRRKEEPKRHDNDYGDEENPRETDCFMAKSLVVNELYSRDL